MSTKGLMAHKKVAEVTLNEAGKAATLTLAPGWLFEGSRGPFTLTNVEHGHKIVKGAVSDGSAPQTVRKAPTPKASPSPGGGAAPEPQAGPRERTPGQFDYVPGSSRHKDEAFVYRGVLKDKNGHEVCGWFRYTEETPLKKVKARATEALRPYAPKHFDLESATIEAFRWTQKMQSQARKDNTLGSPWMSENHGG